MLVDSRYFEQATKITHKTSVVLVSNNYEGALVDLLKSIKVKEITIARNGLYLSDYENIVLAMVSSSIKISVNKANIDNMRIAKEKEEIKIIRDNLNRAEKAMTKTYPDSREKVTRIIIFLWILVYREKVIKAI